MSANVGPNGELDAYDRASAALLDLIRAERSGGKSAAERRARAGAKQARTRQLLKGLGDPHIGYPIIHVTGTSGKGSTCAAIAAILTAAGYRVGLRTSPYVQVATEKLQIGTRLIDASSFEAITHRVLELGVRTFSDEHVARGFGYAEAWNGLAFTWFAERQVDVAIVEVGAGGRFDSTNVVEPLVSVITSVGLDHVVSLGPTLADIAWHKAGIIKPGATTVIGRLPNDALSVVADCAATAGSPIVNASTSALPQGLSTGMPGRFQAANAQIAAVTATVLRRLGFDIPDIAVTRGLGTARLPARLERMPGCGHTAVWIDGAHNGDKIAALAGEIPHIVTGGPLPVIVLGVLGAKDAGVIAGCVGQWASAVVATQPTVKGKRALPSAELAATVKATGFRGPVHNEPDPLAAVARAESLARARGSSVLVTGSLYLAGEVRRRWYPDADVVVQRTPWPDPECRSS